MPPAWEWFNKKSFARETDRIPISNTNGKFFHENGLICAPWNRLAYNQIDGILGLHKDWFTAGWLNNSWTRGCTTLVSMAMVIHFKLQKEISIKQT